MCVETVRSESKTVMFMSSDIVRSTAFKETHQGTEERPDWLEPFEAFFRELPLVLMGQVARTFKEAEVLPKEVGVWRVSGDEIVFSAEPRSADEALLLTEAFYRMVVSYDARLFERWPLRLRGCCWAARCPGRNIEIEIPEMASARRRGGGTYYEYLGPDVDTGFRIAGYADAGRVMVSLNLAEALANVPDQRGLRFHYVGREPLKGVFGGRPYPLFLITYADALPELWQWELEESSQVRRLRDEPPMDPAALVELARKIQSYLNRMCRLNLKPLEF